MAAHAFCPDGCRSGKVLRCSSDSRIFLGLLGATATRFLTATPTHSEVLAVVEKSSAVVSALGLHNAFLYFNEEKFYCSAEPWVSVI